MHAAMNSFKATAVVLSVCLSCCMGSDSPTYNGALVIPPSGKWYVDEKLQRQECARDLGLISGRDGPDGPWPSFYMSVGSDEQRFRAFPAMNQQIDLVPTNVSWCDLMDTKPSFCEERGAIQLSNSKTWVQGTIFRTNAGFSSNTRSGEDILGVTGTYTVMLGDGRTKYPVIEQGIALTASEDFPMALFGLLRESVEIGNGTSKPSSVTSRLARLRHDGIIYSESYSYHAGRLYRKLQCLYASIRRHYLTRSRYQTASLIIGGYDEALSSKEVAPFLYSIGSEARGIPNARLSSISFMSE